MYRPFLFFITFFIPGIVIGAKIKNTAVFGFLAVAALLSSIFFHNRKVRIVFAAVLFIFLGSFYYNFRLGLIEGSIMELADKNCTLVGVIKDAPVVKGDKVLYNVKSLYLKENQRLVKVDGRLRLTSTLDNEKSVYRYGDIISFSGKLKIPQGRRNPHGFNYRSYLMQKGICATMFSREIAYCGKQLINPLIAGAFELREKIKAFYNSSLPANLAALLTGIVLGIKDNIPGETMKAIQQSGIAHVLAVSGLHMGIIYGAARRILDKVNLQGIPAFILENIIIIFYSFVTGLTPSVMRAGIMIMVFMLSQIVGRKNDSINTLCFSAAIILLINPLTLFSVSFQLSFSAVTGILLFYDNIRNLTRKCPPFLRDAMAVIISAQLAVLPFLIFYFHRFSLIGFLINLIVVPFAGLILITGLFSGLVGCVFFPLGQLSVKIPGFLLYFVEKILFTASQLPFSSIVVPPVSPTVMALYFIFLITAFGHAPFSDKLNINHKTIFGIILILAILQPIILPEKSVEVIFIDVGQGDSILIKTRNRGVVLIDGGGVAPYYNSDFDTGEDIVLPLLYSKGISHIDAVIFTHFDDDHARGLLSVLKSVKVKNIIYGLPEESDIYKEMQEIAEKKNIKTVQVARGDSFVIDGVKFEVLNPALNQGKSYSGNNNSVVIKMTYKGISFLFTGDLEWDGEHDLINSGLNIQAQVLKVGHHGSATSTSKEFLSKVRPLYAVISVGKDNNFGHPSPKVLELLEAEDVTVFRTDKNGGVSFKISNKTLKIYTTIAGS